MAKTLKGLESALKKAKARRAAWIDRAETALSHLFYVDGNPAKEWIVISRTLFDVYRNQRGGHDICRFIIEIESRNRRVYRRVNHWYKDCTKKAVARLLKIAERIDYWDEKAYDIESEIEDFCAE